MTLKFLNLLKLLAPEGEGGGGGSAPQPAAPATGEPPAPPAGGDGSLVTEGETGEAKAPEGNGSLVSEGEGDEPPKAPGEGEPPVSDRIDLSALQLPEGMKADDPSLGKLNEILSNKDLKPQERAQQLLDTYKSAATSVAEAAAKAVSDNYHEINRRWVEEVKADPEIGGAKMPEALATVRKALDTWGDGKALRQDLALSGMGNNPNLIRLIHKMATELGEGRPAQGGTPAQRKSAAEVWYPSHSGGDAAAQGA